MSFINGQVKLFLHKVEIIYFSALASALAASLYLRAISRPKSVFLNSGEVWSFDALKDRTTFIRG